MVTAMKRGRGDDTGNDVDIVEGMINVQDSKSGLNSSFTIDIILEHENYKYFIKWYFINDPAMMPPRIVSTKFRKNDGTLTYPFHAAIAAKNFDAVHLMSNSFPEIVLLQEDNGKSSMQLACESEDDNIVKLLLAKYIIKYEEPDDHLLKNWTKNCPDDSYMPQMLDEWCADWRGMSDHDMRKVVGEIIKEYKEPSENSDRSSDDNAAQTVTTTTSHPRVNKGDSNNRQR